MEESEEKKKEQVLVEGMTCSNCAAGIKKGLESEGIDVLDVDFSSGEVEFNSVGEGDKKKAVDKIKYLGYKVREDGRSDEDKKGLSPIEKKFFASLVFTIPLFSHMFLPFEFLHNPLVQLGLCLPPFFIGLFHFGKSAFSSLKTGVPNMDVLIFIGSTAAFGYSLAGTIMYFGTDMVSNYLFYETSATIITLVLLGNLLEHKSVQKTTTAIKELSSIQKTNAKKIVSENGKEEIVEIPFEEVKKGDIIQLNNGDQVPVDGEITKGEALLNESIISGESTPLSKQKGDKVIGGSTLADGNFIMHAEIVGDETILSKIIQLVKDARKNQPSIQRLGDKVSAIFVPIVIGISLITFLIWYFMVGIPLEKALMNSIAVLVISCPCAMGLATPTAVMSGIGRAAKMGILIKGGNTLEVFAKTKKMVFDKTGTLTTGDFELKSINPLENHGKEEITSILYSLEKHSSHPLAVSIVKQLKDKTREIELREINEIKGQGITGKDNEGNQYKAGSYRMAEGLTTDKTHSIYIIKNEKLIGTIEVVDEMRKNVPSTIQKIEQKGISTILLSGDLKEKCEEIAKAANISVVHSEMQPEEKLKIIDELKKKNNTTMVGDGINDAPALTRADTGISLSNSTQVAIQSAQIVLLNNNDFSSVYDAYLISHHTLKTIKQNLFWAFFYNVLAIPIAAAGLLNPMIAALSMAFSDVIVIGNSIRLKSKKLK